MGFNTRRIHGELDNAAPSVPTSVASECATLTYMGSSVGIRALQQNASAVVSRVESGESIEITDRGRPVARLVPILSTSAVEALRTAGRVREATRPLELIVRPPKRSKEKVALSSVLADMRADER